MRKSETLAKDSKLNIYSHIALFLSFCITIVLSITVFINHGTLFLLPRIDEFYEFLNVESWGIIYLSGILAYFFMFFILWVFNELLHIFYNFRHIRIINLVNINIADMGIFIDVLGSQIVFKNPSEIKKYLQPVRYKKKAMFDEPELILLYLLASFASWAALIIILLTLILMKEFSISKLYQLFNLNPSELKLLCLTSRKLTKEEILSLINEFTSTDK